MLKYLIYIIIGIILYLYTNSYNTFSIGIPTEYYDYVLSMLRARKEKLKNDKASVMILNYINPNPENTNQIGILENDITQIDVLIQELIDNPNGITDDRLIQIDNTEFFNIFIRRCAANTINNQRQ